MITEEGCGARCIEQFVQNVDDFGSQYGSEISVTYTLFNIRGPPSSIPDYEDWPKATVMRTHGRQRLESPSSQKDCSQDFVEVSFKQQVYPTSVSVFESFNPGRLARLWAEGPAGWLLLWEGTPEGTVGTPRVFTPPIRRLNVPSRKLRLEFNHELLPYYTELDAVLLKGTEVLSDAIKRDVLCHTLFNDMRTAIVEEGQTLNYVVTSNPKTAATHASPNVTRVGRDTRDVCDKCDVRDKCDGCGKCDGRDTRDLEQCALPLGYFEMLPDEVTLAVLRRLDARSLSRCARASPALRELAADASLYKVVDLRRYWACVRTQTLQTFAQRCSLLQELDLSWCGGHGALDSACLAAFLKECGGRLTRLRLNYCKFVDGSVLAQVAQTCTRLEELSLRSLSATSLDWSSLSQLTRLRRLDLYRSDIPTQAAVDLINANPDLQHLNVGSCNSISSMDDVAAALGRGCPGLVSVNFWKSYSLTGAGLTQLAPCCKLQELDVGWCLQAAGSCSWLRALGGGGGGGGLRALQLGGARGEPGAELRALLPRLRRLARLELPAARRLEAAACDEILEECQDLRLLDVSYCDNITYAKVQEWADQYPHVMVKTSFQSSKVHTPSSLFLSPTLV